MADRETPIELESSRSRTKYKTEAEVELLALSGQPRILDFDDIWEEHPNSIKSKDFRVEDLLFTMIYYTHGVVGAREMQLERPYLGKSFSYKIQLFRFSNEPDSAVKTIKIVRRQNEVQIWANEDAVHGWDSGSGWSMTIIFKVLPGGLWTADLCETGWTIRHSDKPEHLKMVSTFVAMSLTNMIVGIRRKDGGMLGGKYHAELA